MLVKSAGTEYQALAAVSPIILFCLFAGSASAGHLATPFVAVRPVPAGQIGGDFAIHSRAAGQIGGDQAIRSHAAGQIGGDQAIRSHAAGQIGGDEAIRSAVAGAQGAISWRIVPQNLMDFGSFGFSYQRDGALP